MKPPSFGIQGDYWKSDAILIFLYMKLLFITIEVSPITLSRYSVPSKGPFSSLLLGTWWDLSIFQTLSFSLGKFF